MVALSSSTGWPTRRPFCQFIPYEIFRRELTVKGSFAQTHCFDRALGVLRSGRVRTEGIVTHQFHLDAYDRALEALRNDPSCMKAVIVPGAIGASRTNAEDRVAP